MEVAAAAADLERRVVEQLVEHDRAEETAAQLTVAVLTAELSAHAIGELQRLGIERHVRIALMKVSAGEGADGELAAAEAAARDIERRRRHPRERDRIARNVATAELHAVQGDVVLITGETEHRKRWRSVVEVADERDAGNRRCHRREIPLVGERNRSRCVAGSALGG